MNAHPEVIASQPQRGVQRVRHETRLRQLRVLRTLRLTPGMIRVTLGGADLAGFTSLAADDHVKVFFSSRPDEAPGLPVALPAGVRSDPDAPRSIARDYTPRRFDAVANELDIEFALHGDGPAAQWAAQAAPGQMLTIGGPRGSLLVRGDFDWYLLAGDETAIPAIARRLEELPAGARVFAIIEVDSVSEELALPSRAGLDLRWLHRGSHPPGSPELLSAALAGLRLPAGVGYTWLACEANVARHLRTQLLAQGHDRQWLKAAGYWKLGASAAHEKFED